MIGGATTELVVGVVAEPSFGPIVMLGLGGVATDVLGDRTFRAAPVSDMEARQMVLGLKSAPLLLGYRGAPPADVEPSSICFSASAGWPRTTLRWSSLTSTRSWSVQVACLPSTLGCGSLRPPTRPILTCAGSGADCRFGPGGWVERPWVRGARDAKLKA